MRDLVASLLIQAVKAAQEVGELPAFEVEDACVERPADTTNGDFSSTLALKSARLAKKAPIQIAQSIVAHMPKDSALDSVEVAGPGFINFKLSPAAALRPLTQARTQGLKFARNNFGEGQKVQVEFVSANPVGPMHMGHGRWAAFGDSLCRIFDHCGYQVQREFYINDAGVQMDVFARSISERYLQIAALVEAQGLSAQEAADALEYDRENFVSDEGAAPYHEQFMQACGESSYGGEYIIRIAQNFYEQDGSLWAERAQEERELVFRERGYKAMMDDIKATLKRADVEFNVYFSERSLHEEDAQGMTAITRAFARMREAGSLYEKDGALWFRSTEYGDDKDRVLVKSDGSYTYFAADIAYHDNKYERGFDKVINLWGADHHGYIPRMMAATAALGHPGKLEVLLGQLVNLLRNGEPVRMSKRKGTMITFSELLDEVGKDASRYILVSRSTDQEIDFDIELAKKQSADNPVYYVQYAHARICSLIRKALLEKDVVADEQAALSLSREELAAELAKLAPLDADLIKLRDTSELEIARLISNFEELLCGVARDRAPHRLTHYAQSLAAAFHQFYQRCHVLNEDEELSAARLALCDAVRTVLELSLSLLGVSAPLKM